MKKILLLIIFFAGIEVSAQVIADPALSQVKLTSLSDTVIDALRVPLNGTVKLKIPTYNFDLFNALPNGTCKIKIGLGSKLIPQAGFNLNNILPGSYFLWSSVFFNGQYQITGDLIAQLPPNYSDTVVINVEGNILGNSTITVNFLVSNHNSSVILSDENPTNNTSFIGYTVVESGGVTPVNFRDFAAVKIGCNINVAFKAENEINVKKYEIETSKDGIRFIKVGEIIAANLLRYSAGFALTTGISGSTIFVRARSVDWDGRYMFSEIRAVSGTCTQTLQLSAYPSLLHNTDKITVIANNGLLNGNYRYTVLDATGKLINQQSVILNNVSQFNITMPGISSGAYFIHMQDTDGSRMFVVKFQKL